MCLFAALFMIFTSFLTFIISNAVNNIKNIETKLNPIYIMIKGGRFITLSIGLTLTVLIIFQLFNRVIFLLKWEYALIDKLEFSDKPVDYGAIKDPDETPIS
ncbi:hypothetical protein D3C86_1798310 [compost metagenome]